MIEIVGLSKTYAGTGRPALNNVSLHVPKGAIYGILGRSGAGKSTLLRAILGEVPHTGVLHYVDAKGLACPMPLLKLKMALRSLNIGDCVYLTATDPNSEHDIGAFCRHTGHSLVNIATPIVALTHLDKNTDTIFHLIITKNC